MHQNSHRSRPIISSRRSPSHLVSDSPYSADYKVPLSGVTKALIAHRTHINKWTHADLEDKYLRLLDEHHRLKQENLNNHDKIRKLVTRVVRLTSGQTRSTCSTPSGRDPDDADLKDALHMRILDLESHIAQLRDRSRPRTCETTSQHVPSRCGSTSTFRSASVQAFRRTKPIVYKSQESLRIDVQNASKTEEKPTQLALTNSEAVNENDITELKTIIEQLQKDLQANKQCDDCFRWQDENARLRDIGKLRFEADNIQFAEQQQHFEKQLENHRKQTNDLIERLDSEMDIKKTLIAAKDEVEKRLSAAQQCQQEAQDIKAENVSLKKHRDNVANLANELARRNETIRELQSENGNLRAELDAVRQLIVNSEQGHEERMRRMHALQDGHDELAVQLEGMRSQYACLESFNRQLEMENRRLAGDHG